MSDKQRLKVVLCWHMHQPHYRNSGTGEYELPWTYLHAIKDYVDMAEIIGAEPKAKAVVNFAPVLLEQLADYASQIRGFIRDKKTITDPLLAALAAEHLPESSDARLAILRACLRANEQRLIKRFPRYEKMATIARWILDNPEEVLYLKDQFLRDLLVWYHLAWTGETVRRNSAVIQQLQERARGFTYDDCMQLLGLFAELIESVVPTYAALQNKGQVELAFSPYMHPILPLLLDFNSAAQAMPGALLPTTPQYPGGEARAKWHVEKGLEVFTRAFGVRPQGCWPSEGSLSEEALSCLDGFDLRWAASGGSVLHNSIGQSPALELQLKGKCIHRAYRLKDQRIVNFFRDDGLSDLIGFTYSSWHSDDATNNLIHHLENIAAACPDKENAVVSIILDGENAWEYYPENAYFFLKSLYRKLGNHPEIELTTFSSCITPEFQAVALEKLVAGSWVYGTFSTWIGDKDKNRGWDLLCDAKKAVDRVLASGAVTDIKREKIINQLAICEGSDWFWWLGDYNPAESVSDFEKLFRTHMTELYRLIGVEAPTILQHVISRGGGAPAAGGVMRQGQA